MATLQLYLIVALAFTGSLYGNLGVTATVPGKPCDDTKDCDDGKLYVGTCNGTTKVCDCQPIVAKTDGTACVATAPGLSCNDDTVCASADQALYTETCGATGVCGCRPKTKAIDKECRAVPGQKCDGEADCPAAGKLYTHTCHSTKKVCDCRTDVAKAEGAACVATAPGLSCNDDTVCASADQALYTETCGATGVCGCRPKTKAIDKECRAAKPNKDNTNTESADTDNTDVGKKKKNGSSTLVSSLVVTLVCLMLTSLWA